MSCSVNSFVPDDLGEMLNERPTRLLAPLQEVSERISTATTAQLCVEKTGTLHFLSVRCVVWSVPSATTYGENPDAE